MHWVTRRDLTYNQGASSWERWLRASWPCTRLCWWQTRSCCAELRRSGPWWTVPTYYDFQSIVFQRDLCTAGVWGCPLRAFGRSCPDAIRTRMLWHSDNSDRSRINARWDDHELQFTVQIGARFLRLRAKRTPCYSLGLPVNHVIAVEALAKMRQCNKTRLPSLKRSVVGKLSSSGKSRPGSLHAVHNGICYQASLQNSFSPLARCMHA